MFVRAYGMFAALLTLGVGTVDSILTAQSPLDTPTFHNDRQRTGWRTTESLLTPANVSSGRFGPLWNSPQLDSVTIGSTTFAPHLYASPLYVDSVNLSAGPYAGSTFSVIFAATSNAYVYAVNAFPVNGVNPVAAGTILWSTKLSTASMISDLDGGVPLGVLATPIIDSSASPPRLYVASMDAAAGWQVFALNLTGGAILPGWPVSINNNSLAPVNQNGPTVFQSSSAMSQRGALNLSPDGKLLYVPFGAYSDGGTGWMVAVDTVTPSVASAFAGAPSNVAFANGGMWSAGGPALDAVGRVYVTTGNGTTQNETTPGYWGNSVLAWQAGVPLTLAGTYTPWNYCQMDTADIDLSGGAAVVLPNLSVTGTTTPDLLAFGGKQGNDYLIDRDHLPGSLSLRQGCGSNAAADGSLLPPGIQPQFGTRGPLNVFGPYSDTLDNNDYAKSRSTPAYFQAADGSLYLFVTGSSKQNANSTTTVPPGIARLKIVTPFGQPAYLSIDQYENTLTLLSAGSPIITSNGSANPVLWVLVANVLRTQSLLSPTCPHPILYALDPFTMQVLWQSTPAQLNVGGKYNTPAVARGTVFVGTDRIQAFGLQESVMAVAGTPQSAAVNTMFATALKAKVTDAGNNPVAGVTVTFTAPASGASGTFAGGVTTATAVTDGTGVATAPAFTANGTAGNYTVTASVTGVSSPANFGLTNTAGTSVGISLVQQASVNVASGTTASVTLGRSPTAGDFLVCVTGSYPPTSTIASMAGGGVNWARVNGSNVNRNAEIWVGGNSSGSGATITITYTGGASGSGFVVNCSEWSGIAGSGYTDASATNSGNSADPSAGTVSTGNANDLVIGMVRGGFPAGGGVFQGPANGFTGLNSPRTDWAFAAAYEIVSSTGTYSTNWSTNPTTSAVWDGVIAAFKAR